MKYRNTIPLDYPLGLDFVIVALIATTLEDGHLNPLNSQHFRVIWVNTVKYIYCITGI